MKKYSVLVVGMGKRGMHHAAAFNANDAAACGAIFGSKGELEVNADTTWHGAAEIEAGLKPKFAEFRGLVRAELGEVRGTPVLIVWQYEKTGAKKIACLLRAPRLHAAGTIARAAHDYDPKNFAVAKPAGLMPHDPVFRFDPQQDVLLLDELPWLIKMWTAMKECGITMTGLRNVQALLESKGAAWGRDSEEFERLACTTLQEAGLFERKDKDGNPLPDVITPQDVTSERFAHCLELYLHILKQKIG